ncbi:hypothetical protein QCD85_13205 [Paenibacillus sp. PsM32]|uniref:Qat anti-phage system QueC-like protein QatC n=1 Tax=Paenibacillus sp. PsM32 TaxID=3030536 RepID=UPI00263B7819|nr:Qat anti-phage system QueC-like protein QatC [Paenibacillus sp. PsM32]MDN4619057.1 hypothetical protein [Paenibacillus sp. PsM32]
MNSIWIVKNEEDVAGENIRFNLSHKNNKSHIKTDVENLWRMFSIEKVDPIIEDFLIIGIAVFAIDKKISRRYAEDGWSRGLHLHIPVLEIDKWLSVQEKLEKNLSFLSGDNWNLYFYRTEERFRGNKINEKYNVKNKEEFDCVSLFSGGLDSFCGALKLMDDQKNPLFLGFKEYPLLVKRQQELFSAVQEAFDKQYSDFIQFNVIPSKPSQAHKTIMGESTSRSRSFLFITGAVTVASIIGQKTPVYIPENGFIGVNVPLTESRSGSCSTRTTHPFFINTLNDILNEVGILNKIENFYAKSTKGEIVLEHRDNSVFQAEFSRTLSCSHPCQGRYDKVKPPINCGYCYPCLIRKASLVSNGFEVDQYNPNYNLSLDFISGNEKFNGKASDFKAILFASKRYFDKKEDRLFIRRLLRIQGPLTSAELDDYERVYRNSMEEVFQMIDFEETQNGQGLKKYAGLYETESL